MSRHTLFFISEALSRVLIGPIAQLRLERTPDKREVGSSTLPRPTLIGGVGKWVEGSTFCDGAVAQLGEHRPCKAGVVGSIPSSSTKKNSKTLFFLNI